MAAQGGEGEDVYASVSAALCLLQLGIAMPWTWIPGAAQPRTQLLPSLLELTMTVR